MGSSPPAGTGAGAVGRVAAGAFAVGALAGGAAALGAVAIGRLAVGELAVGRTAVGQAALGAVTVDRLRVRETILDAAPRPVHPFDALHGHRYVNLTTFRQTGEAVATPVWFAVHDFKVYVGTDPQSHKVNRIRDNPSVTLGACSMRGARRGPDIAATARILESDEMPEGAATALRGKYRAQLRIGEFIGQLADYRPVLEMSAAATHQ